MESPSWTALLRTSIAEICEEAQGIQDPDAVLQEKLAVVQDRSWRRIQSFTQGQTNDSALSLQQALLSDGRYIRELELEHAASREQERELHDKAMEALASRIMRNLLNILGLSAIRKMVPELSTCGNIDHPASGYMSFEYDPPSTTRSQLCPTVAEASGQACNHGLWEDGQLYQTAAPVTKSPLTWSTIPKTRRGGLKDNGTAQRSQCIIAGLESLTTESIVHHPERPLSPYFAGTETIHEHSSAEKDIIRKRGKTLCKKSINLGVDGHTTCMLIFKSPVHNKWVSAGHIPEGQPLPSFDKIIADHLSHREAIKLFPPLVKSESGASSVLNGSEYENSQVP